jgi:hypothetical protein
VIIQVTGDELVLAIIAIVRVVNPTMLKPEDGDFTVDFTPLMGKREFTSGEKLLIKLRTASESGSSSLDLDRNEARSLAAALQRLELVQVWPIDVLNVSLGLRARLATIV